MTEENQSKTNTKFAGPLVICIALAAVAGFVSDPTWLRPALLVVAVLGMALFSFLLLRTWRRAQKN